MTKVISFKEMEWRDGYNIKNDRSDKKVRKQACVCKPVFEKLFLLIIIIYQCVFSHCRQSRTLNNYTLT